MGHFSVNHKRLQQDAAIDFKRGGTAGGWQRYKGDGRPLVVALRLGNFRIGQDEVCLWHRRCAAGVTERSFATGKN